jgi:hypothetical protein
VAAPTCPHPAQSEIVTPTAAALLAELATFSYPPLRLGPVGYGFGHKDFPWANAVRAWLGEAEDSGRPPQGDEVVLLESNLDDATGEELGYAVERLFAAGALDVWLTPVQMKKGRPGIVLAALAGAILRETPTLGVRIGPPLERCKAGRQVRSVETPFGAVRVKEKWWAGRCLDVSPEYEDCARIARERGLPLRQVVDAVRAAAQADTRPSS